MSAQTMRAYESERHNRLGPNSTNACRTYHPSGKDTIVIDSGGSVLRERLGRRTLEAGTTEVNNAKS